MSKRRKAQLMVPPPLAESIAAVLDACDGHMGIVDDGAGRREGHRYCQPPWFAELARVARSFRNQPKPPPPAKETRQCVRCKRRSFKCPPESKRRYCDDCYNDIRQESRTTPRYKL